MNARALLGKLRGLGVGLTVDGALLRVDAPAGALTEELRVALAEHKQGLITLLEWERHKREEADGRGLVIRWSKVPGWIVLRDPTDGRWLEVKVSECLPGIVEAANAHRRKKKEVRSSE